MSIPKEFEDIDTSEGALLITLRKKGGVNRIIYSGPDMWPDGYEQRLWAFFVLAIDAMRKEAAADNGIEWKAAA